MDRWHLKYPFIDLDYDGNRSELQWEHRGGHDWIFECNKWIVTESFISETFEVYICTFDYCPEFYIICFKYFVCCVRLGIAPAGNKQYLQERETMCCLIFHCLGENIIFLVLFLGISQLIDYNLIRSYSR